MKVLGTAAALVLLESVGAHAQVVIADPAPIYVAPAPIYSPAPVVVAPPAVVLPPAVGSAYAAAPVYGGDCYWVRRRVVDGWGQVFIRRVQVCD